MKLLIIFKRIYVYAISVCLILTLKLFCSKSFKVSRKISRKFCK